MIQYFFKKLRDIDFAKLLKKSMEEKINGRKMQSMLKNANNKSARVIDDNEVSDLFGL